MKQEASINSEDFSLQKPAPNLEGLYPLCFAAKYGLSDYIKNKTKTMSKEDRLDALSLSNENHFTALHYACRYGHTDTVALLLSLGAKNEPTLTQRNYPIHLIFSYVNQLETCDALFEKLVAAQPSNLQLRDVTDTTVAHLAAQKGAVNILEKIAKQDPGQLNFKNNQSITPLMAALLANQKGSVQYLLDNSDIQLRNSRGLNAFHIAAQHATPEIISLMLPYFASTMTQYDKDLVCDALNHRDEKGVSELVAQALNLKPAVSKI